MPSSVLQAADSERTRGDPVPSWSTGLEGGGQARGRCSRCGYCHVGEAQGTQRP